MLNRANYTPTLVFFGEGGRLLLRLVGYYPPGRFRQVLDYLDSKAYERQTFRDYVLASSQTPGTDGSPIIADALFEKPPCMLDRSRIPAQRPLLVVFEGSECADCERYVAERAYREHPVFQHWKFAQNKEEQEVFSKK